MSKLTVTLILLLLLGLVLAVVCATLVHVTPSASPWLVAILELFERFGDALAIAAIVGGVIERIAFQKELLERSRDFFIRYFGRLLPSELQKRLRDYLEISIIRTEWNISYDIEHWPDKPGYLRLITESRYTMENRSEQQQTCRFLYEVENSLCPEIAETCITGIRLINDEYDEDVLKDEHLIKSERGYQIFERSDITLPPFKKIGRGVYEFEARSVECFKGVIVSPFWSVYPVIKTKFSIKHPQDVEVFFEVTFGDTSEMTEKKERSENSRKETVWTITKPILPGQGFEVRCNLKPPTQKPHYLRAH
jgi:hypothetical protein